MKIAINKCFGGFSVSEAVYSALGKKWDGHGFLDNDDFEIKSDNDLEYRKHPKLIEAIEKLGIENASGALAKVVIVDIPDEIEWEIEVFDGMETILEARRSW